VGSSNGSGEHPAVRIELPDGQGVQIGDHGTQYNTFIQNYIAGQAVSPTVTGTVVAGDVPQQPAAFQPRPWLLEELEAGGPGIAVVRAVTGMRGVGKTQAATAYARACIDAGWRAGGGGGAAGDRGCGRWSAGNRGGAELAGGRWRPLPDGV